MTEFLNVKQRQAFDAIAAGHSIFLTGPGGTGKSFLLKHIFEDIPKQTGRTIALTALTGCAALLLDSKAKTLHSWAGIGLGTDSVPLLVSSIRKSRRAHMRWIATDILVIDEISMMTPELFEKLDELGRKLRRNETRPFGGIQLVLVGDFFQLPPVTKSDEQEDTAFVFESPVWKTLNLQIHELDEIVRQKDLKFQQVLNEARRGELTKPSLKILSKRMGLDTKDQLIQPTLLFTRRAQVDEINMSHLRKLTTDRHFFKAATVFLPKAETQGLSDKDPLVLKAVAKLDGNAQYTPELILAIGAQVMLVTNMDPESGLVNGSRGVVTGFQKINADGTETVCDLPTVRFRNGLELPIPHSTWEVSDYPGVMRRQIPLRLAYAITIHKSQGATLDCALVDVGPKTFEFGQAYVALSRVKDIESLYIHDLEATAFKAHPKVKEFYASFH